MKGISMPINLIVIIAIAVLVLIVLAAFFSGAFITGTDSIKLAAAIDSGCARLRQVYNCVNSNIDSMQIQYQLPSSSVQTQSLRTLCERAGYLRSPVDECAVHCGCPGTTP